MTNFTKGPWVVAIGGYPKVRSVQNDCGTDICCFYEDDESGEACKPFFNDVANAHLIAAAPDMYNSIDGAMQCFHLVSGLLHRDNTNLRDEVKRELDEHIGNMKEALAKARGEL